MIKVSIIKLRFTFNNVNFFFSASKDALEVIFASESVTHCLLTLLMRLWWVRIPNENEGDGEDEEDEDDEED